jgi:hypothetical protein
MPFLQYAMNADQTALVAPYDNIDNYKIYVADNIHYIDATKMNPYWSGTYNYGSGQSGIVP